MKRKRPWLQNLSLTMQTVAEHIADDPVLLGLQISRRLPPGVRSGVGETLARAGGLGKGSLEAFGHEVSGNREAAQRSVLRTLSHLEHGASPLTRRRSIPHLADLALAMGDVRQASRLLDRLAADQRRGPWFAAAARVAMYEGDIDGAVDLASRHPHNTALARRAVGEQRVFAGYEPRLSPEQGYAPEPRRVMHVLTNSLPHTSSGYAQRSHSILKSLAERGYQVRAVTRPGYPVQVGVPWGADLDTVDGIEYSRLLPARLGQGLDERLDQHAAMLAEEVRRFRPAILHTTTHFVNGLVVGAVARAFGIPWVYEVRGQLADTWASTRDPSALDSQRYRQFVERELHVARSADAVVTLGAHMKEALIRGGADSERISVCPNAVGKPFIDTPPTREAARQRLGLSADRCYVGTVSSIVDYEGLDLLVRAVARLAPAYPRLRLRIAGDGVALPGLKVLAAQLGIADRADFPGRVDRAEAIWNHAALDIFAVPRKDLSVTRSVTPMKTVEASAVGRPVIASNLPALEELVEDGSTGLLFAAGDVEDLAAAIARLIDDPRQRLSMGEAARRWALETRTWTANAQTYSTIYDRLGRPMSDAMNSA